MDLDVATLKMPDCSGVKYDEIPKGDHHEVR